MNDKAKPAFAAACECGDLRFSSSRAPVSQLCCHCRDCREATSDDFSTIAFFATHHIEFVGEASEKQFMSDSGVKTSRQFCAKCKTVMFDCSDGFEALLGVFANRLEPLISDPAPVHVWTRSKLPHVVLPNGARCFEKGLPV